MVKNKMAKLEIRVETDDRIILNVVRDQLEEIWPFAFSSEITQNERNPRMDWFRLYLTLSLPIPKEDDRNE